MLSVDEITQVGVVLTSFVTDGRTDDGEVISIFCRYFEAGDTKNFRANLILVLKKVKTI
jgi:hypothetical protein